MARLRGSWHSLGTQQKDSGAQAQNSGRLRSPNPTGSPTLSTGQEIIKQSTPKKDHDISESLKNERKDGALKPCHATGKPAGILNGVEAQFVHCFQPPKGKRSVRANCQVNQVLKNVMEAEHPAVSGLSKSLVEFQKEQYAVLPNQQVKEHPEVNGLSKSRAQFQKADCAVLPTQQVKEALPSTIKRKELEGVDGQTETALKRKRGRPKGSGVQCANGTSKSQASGLSLKGKGTGVLQAVYSRRQLRLSGDFLAEERSGGKEEDGEVISQFWTSQEIEALLDIKSNIGPTRRGQLWQNVSRKLAEKGYTRSAKKCKEKFSNVQYPKKRKEEDRAVHLGVKNTPLFSHGEELHNTSNASTALASTGTSVGAAKRDLAVAQIGGLGLLSQIAKEHGALSSTPEKFNPRMVEENGGMVDEAANSDSTIVHTDHSHVLDKTAQKHPSPLSLGKVNHHVEEETGADNQLTPGEVITLRHASSKSSKHPLPSNEVESSFCLGERRDKRAPQSSIDVGEKAISSPMQQDEGSLPLENESLPFIKSSKLWGVVEAMQAFKEMPQHPHFHPLRNKSEEKREGTALGFMCSFAGLVEGAHKATLEDPRSMFETKLEALNELEKHGFNVQSLISQTEALLRLKDKYDEFEKELMQIQELHNLAKQEFNAMQQSVVQLRAQREELFVEKEKRCSFIAQIQRTMEEDKNSFSRQIGAHITK